MQRSNPEAKDKFSQAKFEDRDTFYMKLNSQLKSEFDKLESSESKITGEIQFNKKTGEIFAKLGNHKFKVNNVGSSKDQLKNTYFMRTIKGVKEDKSEFRFPVESKVAFMPTNMKFNES